MIIPLSPAIAVESWELPGVFRADPADRIIVATARATGATLLTRDRRILDYAACGYLTAIAA
jgi:PIN domain nuclease of toxin-antitoxin system